MPQLSVLLLGDTGRPEFTEAGQVLEGMARVIPAAGIDAACALLDGGLSDDDEDFAVDLIVVAQAYPGQFSGDAMDRLSRLAPLARVVGLLGSWCEGEVRSGRPWPGAVRVYWHQWLACCHQELGRMEQGLFSSWCLPPTATDEERLLARADHDQPADDARPRRQGQIAIYSPSFDMRDWLSRACRRVGYATVADLAPGEYTRGRQSAAHAAIFDAFDCRGEELDEIRRLIDALRPAPVIVLMSFPRVEDRDRVLAAGAAALLSKPLVLEDLYWQMEDCKLKIEN